MESLPQQEKHEMVDPEIVDNVRNAIIADFEQSIEIYTHKGTITWVGEKKAREIIENLRNKYPVEFGAGEFWGGALPHAIVVGQGIGYDDPRYEEIKKRIVEGEVQ